MKRLEMLYLVLNGLFHFAHIVIIMFVMIGWIFPHFLLAHLTLVLLTLSSWFILGHWLGIGYCPISDWHWKIKATLGEGRPKGTYIHLLLQKIARRELNSATVDKIVLIGTMVIMGISFVLNIKAW